MDEKMELVAKSVIPIYHFTRGREAAIAPAEPEYAGKIVHLIQPESPVEASALSAGIGDLDELLEALTDRDVVWAPLYQSNTNNRLESWPSSETSPHYAMAMDLLRAVAPRVQAVLIGQMGCELCWFHRNNTFNPLVVNFVRDTAAIVHDAGGRPAYGTVDWDLLVDCYCGQSRMAEAMLRVNALQICYCGYTLAADGWYDRGHGLYADQAPFIARHDKGREKLSAYLHAVDIWSGVNFIDGLKGGNDKALQNLGFRAGMIG